MTSLRQAVFVVALANFAYFVVEFVVAVSATGWLDIAVGIAIGLLNADAAREVWTAARTEVDARP